MAAAYICSMIVYNVTIKVAHQIAAPWLEWMKTEHMPRLMASGCFTGSRLFYLMEQDESDGITYCAQYDCNTYEDYKRYLDLHAAAIRQEGQQLWGNGYIAFRTVMRREA